MDAQAKALDAEVLRELAHKSFPIDVGLEPAPPQPLDLVALAARATRAPAVVDPVNLRRDLAQLGKALAGMALFGFVLRTASEQAIPGLGHLAWAVGLPGALGLAWLICLPALYIFWASKEDGVGAREYLSAAAAAIVALGAALASTAPMLWFFAVTAPHSRTVAPLAFLFMGLALSASGAIFGSRLRAFGGKLSHLASWSFLMLLILTFAQFAHLYGIHWF